MGGPSLVGHTNGLGCRACPQSPLSSAIALNPPAGARLGNPEPILLPTLGHCPSPAASSSTKSLLIFAPTPSALNMAIWCKRINSRQEPAYHTDMQSTLARIWDGLVWDGLTLSHKTKEKEGAPGAALQAGEKLEEATQPPTMSQLAPWAGPPQATAFLKEHRLR